VLLEVDKLPKAFGTNNIFYTAAEKSLSEKEKENNSSTVALW
jgi:hypothetical protein